MTRRFTVDTRLVAAALLAAVAALVVLSLTTPPETVGVAVTEGPIAAGVRLADAELTTRQVVDPSGLVLADELDHLSDHVIGASIGPDAPLPVSLLRGPGDGAAVDVVGLELEAHAGVHGSLEPGDGVDVYVTEPEIALVAGAVPVVDVLVDDGALGAGTVGVILAVDSDLAPSIIAASASGSIHLVRRGG